MATEKTKAEIKARIAQLEAKLQGLSRGTPEFAQALANLNKQKGLIGQPEVKAQDIKLGAGKQPDVNTPPPVPAPATVTPVPTPQITDDTQLTKPVEKVVDAQQAAADLAAQQNVQLGTAGTQTNPYGSQTIKRDPVTGEIIQDVKLSDPQQKILDQGQDLTSQGQNLASKTLGGLEAGFNPETVNRYSTGDLEADRARIEDQIFGRLTRGLDEQKGNERQQLEQTLRNRGIPLGSKQFNDQMAQFDKRYDTQIADAKAQATQMGGQELQANFGMNEQQIANQISQAQAIKNQNIGEAQAYQGMGTGLMTPEFQGYQGTQYQTPDVLGAYGAVTQAQQGDKALSIEQQNANTAAKAANRGPSGGGGSTTTTKSPFNNTVAS